jgi:hypothetical protein
MVVLAMWLFEWFEVMLMVMKREGKRTAETPYNTEFWIFYGSVGRGWLA